MKSGHSTAKTSCAASTGNSLKKSASGEWPNLVKISLIPRIGSRLWSLYWRSITLAIQTFRQLKYLCLTKSHWFSKDLLRNWQLEKMRSGRTLWPQSWQKRETSNPIFTLWRKALCKSFRCPQVSQITHALRSNVRSGQQMRVFEL